CARGNWDAFFDYW
nr:immunoglobulin heavy chain junction region [Mus musculus]NSM06859.1 immunoglobulin heavy chain junction region [Mus musculus]